MKSFFILLALSLSVIASPCTDSVFVRLSGTPLSQLSTGEAVYFTTMKTRCEEYQEWENKKKEIDNNFEEANKHAKKGVQVGLFVTIMIAILSAITITCALNTER